MKRIALAVIFSFALSAADEAISVDFANTAIDDVIKVLSKKLEKNIVAEKGLDAKITVKLEKVSAREVLDIICRTHNLHALDEGNVIILMDDEKFLAKAVRTQKVVRIPVRNVSCRSVFQKIAIGEKADASDDKMKRGVGVSPSGGKLYYDESDNSITVVDNEVNAARIVSLVSNFDVAVHQVLIEAKMVRITLTKNEKFGIDWKQFISGSVSAPLSRAGSSNNVVTVGVGPVSIPVNIPATTITPAINTTLSFEAVVNMLKEDGNVDLLSSPRVVAINGEEAKIHVGRNVPYDVVTVTDKGDKVQDTRFIDVGIILNVTPRIYKDAVLLKLHAESSTADQTVPGQAPTVEKTEADATILARNGENIIFGGLIEKKKSESNNKVPLLGDIPILGWLFKSSEFIDDKSELAIFITVKIL